MGDEIIICDSHQDYLVPLISTFAFPYSEYWCPYCGRTWGMFDTDKKVAITEKLTKRLEKYEKASKKFLKAHAVLKGGAAIEYKGKITEEKDLPQKMLDEYKANLKWEYIKKID